VGFVVFQATLLVLIVGLAVFMAAAGQLRRRRHVARARAHPPADPSGRPSPISSQTRK
jgi:hypothetical protein